MGDSDKTQSAQAQLSIADNGDKAPGAPELKHKYFFNNTLITDATDNTELINALNETTDGDIVPNLTHALMQDMQEVTKTTDMEISKLTGGYRRRKSRKSRKSRRGKKARKSRRTRRHH